MKTMYRVVRYTKDNMTEILATGECKADAEFGLIYDGLEPRKVNWTNYPIERYDPQGGGFTVIYTGVYSG